MKINFLMDWDVHKSKTVTHCLSDCEDLDYFFSFKYFVVVFKEKISVTRVKYCLNAVFFDVSWISLRHAFV